MTDSHKRKLDSIYHNNNNKNTTTTTTTTTNNTYIPNTKQEYQENTTFEKHRSDGYTWTTTSKVFDKLNNSQKNYNFKCGDKGCNATRTIYQINDTTFKSVYFGEHNHIKPNSSIDTKIKTYISTFQRDLVRLKLETYFEKSLHDPKKVNLLIVSLENMVYETSNSKEEYANKLTDIYNCTLDLTNQTDITVIDNTKIIKHYSTCGTLFKNLLGNLKKKNLRKSITEDDSSGSDDDSSDSDDSDDEDDEDIIKEESNQPTKKFKIDDKYLNGGSDQKVYKESNSVNSNTKTYNNLIDEVKMSLTSDFENENWIKFRNQHEKPNPFTESELYLICKYRDYLEKIKTFTVIIDTIINEQWVVFALHLITGREESVIRTQFYGNGANPTMTNDQIRYYIENRLSRISKNNNFNLNNINDIKTLVSIRESLKTPWLSHFVYHEPNKNNSISTKKDEHLNELSPSIIKSNGSGGSTVDNDINVRDMDSISIKIGRLVTNSTSTTISSSNGKHIPSESKHHNHKTIWDDISNGQLSYPLGAVNEVDNKPFNQNFKWISKSFISSNSISIDKNASGGCQCDGDCTSKKNKKSCPCVSNRVFYDKHGCLLRPDSSDPIYECLPSCSCSQDCRTRNIQKGYKYPLQLYKTERMGWGLRAVSEIPPNAFVCEYVGEIISSSEAEDRGRKYDEEGRSYLFDLNNYMGEETNATIDGNYYGNESRFINHSCNPNLKNYEFFSDHIDPRMPRIAFFSTRLIKENEELSFDYKYGPIPEKSKKKDDIKGGIRCHCGAHNCRKWLWIPPNSL